MSKLKTPRASTAAVHQPSGFPLFSTSDEARVVTADPWAFLFHVAEKSLKRPDEIRAFAFVEQAKDFYTNANRSNSAGKPLLYYYAFLNLFKAALLIRGHQIPQVLKHGISDPRANSRERLRLSGQQIRVPNRASDRSEFFPELLHALGWGGACNRTWGILDLLALIPSIHRTYCTVQGCKPSFLPVRRILVLSDSSNVWGRLVVSSQDRDATVVRPFIETKQKFRSVFSPVAAPDADQKWYETRTHGFQGKSRQPSIIALGDEIRRLGLSSILTGAGYRYYISANTPTRFMPRLAAAYAVFFYLGSITRYKPYDFDKIVAGKYMWIVEELLATEPSQLLYATCSWLYGVEVVKPYAVIQ